MALIIIWVACDAIWVVLDAFARARSWPLHDTVLVALGIGAIVGWIAEVITQLIRELRSRNRK